MRRNDWLRSLRHVTLLALAPGCAAVGPEYEQPRPKLPDSWSAMENDSRGLASVAKAETRDLSQWWDAFADPTLSSLVDRALQSNLDLREAAARVRESRAIAGVARGALQPELSAGASYQRTRLSENGQFPVSGGAMDLYQAGFDASWEIDVFGGRQREIEAADAELEASVERLHDTRVILAAEVARNYTELAGLRSRLDIAGQNLEIQRKTAAWTRARLESGWATELDMTRAQALVSTTESAIPALEAAWTHALHRLSVLLGQEPGALAAELAAANSLPAAPAEIPVGMPTDLLRRRPDLRSAEHEIAAATARVGMATSELYPRFFLTGSYGAESVSSGDLLETASRSWSLGPSVRWSLFQGGRIRARIEARDAQQEQAALRFEKTLLQALREVEDALISHHKEQRRRTALAEAVAAQRRAVDLAEQRYEQGLVDFLIVLDAQRGLFLAQDLLVQSEQALVQFAIALYKAVGGGWEIRSNA